MTILNKLIVSNKSALISKYSQNGFGQIESQLEVLHLADEKRSINNTFVYLDDAGQMAECGATPVTDPTNEEQNKCAIDQIFASLNPDFLMILGAQDIIPFQSLENPMPGDTDANVPSDLPYASNSPYSTKIRDFLNPTRITGRVPGVYKSSDTKPLLAALSNSICLEPLARDKYYSDYFAVTAEVWEASTEQSIKNIAGTSDDLRISPPDGPDWTAYDLLPRVHFVNCHGVSQDPNWYGQQGTTYPVAVTASKVLGKEIAGTIAAAECCYGGELYNPGGICNALLASNVCAFCGSSTIAYGPASGQGSADLVTQYFLINMLEQKSSGAAMLAARTRFIQESTPLTPVGLKTVGQFYLLGDPSSTPVGPDGSTEALSGKAVASLQKSFAAKLMVEGENLPNVVGAAELNPDKSVPNGVMAMLGQIEKELDMTDVDTSSYDFKGSDSFMKAKSFALSDQEEVVYLATGAVPGDAKFANRAAIEIITLGENIVSVTKYLSK